MSARPTSIRWCTAWPGSGSSDLRPRRPRPRPPAWALSFVAPGRPAAPDAACRRPGSRRRTAGATLRHAPTTPFAVLALVLALVWPAAAHRLRPARPPPGGAWRSPARPGGTGRSGAPAGHRGPPVAGRRRQLGDELRGHDDLGRHQPALALRQPGRTGLPLRRAGRLPRRQLRGREPSAPRPRSSATAAAATPSACRR